MPKIPGDPFRPDEKSEERAAERFDNSRCIAEIEINDLHRDLFLFNRVVENDIADDWVFAIWIVGGRFRAHFIKEIGIWTRILRDLCINEPNFLHSITKDAIDLADIMIAKNIDLNRETDREIYRKGIYDIIRKHRELISRYEEMTILENTKNPEFIDEIFKEIGHPIMDSLTIKVCKQLNDFFPRGKRIIIGYIIAVSAIYYACRKRRTMDENIPPSWNVLEYCIIKVIEGIDINEIMNGEGNLIGMYNTYYGPEGLLKFEKLLDECKKEREYKLIRWRVMNK